jgi:hypothetical protein
LNDFPVSANCPMPQDDNSFCPSIPTKLPPLGD